MVGGLDPRCDSGGGAGGRCTLQAQYERRGELLSIRGGGTFHERALLNSERFTIDYNDRFRNFNT